MREVIGGEMEDTVLNEWHFSSSFVASPFVCKSFVLLDVDDFNGASGVESKNMGAAALLVEPPPPLRHVRSSSVMSG